MSVALVKKNTTDPTNLSEKKMKKVQMKINPLLKKGKKYQEIPCVHVVQEKNINIAAGGQLKL